MKIETKTYKQKTCATCYTQDECDELLSEYCKQTNLSLHGVSYPLDSNDSLNLSYFSFMYYLMESDKIIILNVHNGNNKVLPAFQNINTLLSIIPFIKSYQFIGERKTEIESCLSEWVTTISFMETPKNIQTVQKDIEDRLISYLKCYDNIKVHRSESLIRKQNTIDVYIEEMKGNKYTKQKRLM